MPGPGCVKVTSVSLQATESLIAEFFSFSGDIESVRLSKDTEDTQQALVIFKDAKSVETALLLTGAVIVDKPVDIEAVDLPADYPVGKAPAAATPDSHEAGTKPQSEAAVREDDKSQGIISTMLARGYILAADTMNKARAVDEKYQGSSTVKAKATAVDTKLGISDKTTAASTTVNKSLKSFDEKYKISETTKSAIGTVEAKINDAGKAMMKNKTVAGGVGWFQSSMKKVGEAASKVSSKTSEKIAAYRAKEGGGAKGDEAPGFHPTPRQQAAPAAVLLSDAAVESRHSPSADAAAKSLGSTHLDDDVPEYPVVQKNS
ncbi:hypothetical protein KFL_000250310 [Klebsormidium nitens]|uniref:RRM domain-containing protein n=1 Tax=Klebsormidium nitens TaxID=105231 RepID=A0A1Y1HKM6_KLENI|nr:hypothetical protein KFL_000250310 [Klebsormidium nitens]|eukprot:GAQ79154.1 hypothetical protein KFL_000250310 [Klebsormidium nitens]